MATKKKYKNPRRRVVYNANKLAKVGDEIMCPVCKNTFVKKYYQQKFCCNECKVKFWNDKQLGKRNAYFHDYNMKHPERLERIGIDTDLIERMRKYHECDGLGDDEAESLGQITLDPSCYEDDEMILDFPFYDN